MEIQIIFVAIGIIITLIGVVYTYMSARIEKIEDRNNIIVEELNKIKTNYLDRFDEIKTIMNQHTNELRESNHKLGNKLQECLSQIVLNLEREFKKKNDCLLTDSNFIQRLTKLEDRVYNE